MSEFIRPNEWIKTARRFVVKVGTSVLTDERDGRVVEAGVRAVASEMAALWKEGRQVILVTSGAIGVGMGILGLKSRPKKLPILQAAAATGQGRLMQWYTSEFERHGLHAAQLLLTREDLENQKRYLNARATLSTLLRSGVVPIINENDSVSTEEIRYGDNDVLSAHLAALMDAEVLVLLSDVDKVEGPTGLPTLITEITPELEMAAKGTAKAVSTGGMKTKLQAARIALASGIPMVLANGRQKNLLIRMVVQGELFGTTWFIPRKGAGFKEGERWAALTGKPKGLIRVDEGARRALAEQGRSLLASGVCEVEGHFRVGELVSIGDGSGKEFARGVVAYSNGDLERIMGLKSDAVEAALGRKAAEVIHRNHLVILRG